jgi:hypothetical protein
MEESSSPLLQNQEGTAIADRNESIRQGNGKSVMDKYKFLQIKQQFSGVVQIG